MIVYDLVCEDAGHRFEGWFGSSSDFAGQMERGLVTCPQCGSAQVTKAVMAPRLTRKGNQHDAPSLPAPASAPVNTGGQINTNAAPHHPGTIPPQARAMLEAVVKAQAEALKSSQWVGRKFAEDARAMHYGEKPAALIHGQTTPDEARALAEEGVPIAPVLFPIAPPDEVN